MPGWSPSADPQVTGLLEERARIDAQVIRDPNEASDRQIQLPELDLLYVLRRESAGFRERGLRQSAFCSHLGDSPSDGPNDEVRVASAHPAVVAEPSGVKIPS